MYCGIPGGLLGSNVLVLLPGSSPISELFTSLAAADDELPALLNKLARPASPMLPNIDESTLFVLPLVPGELPGWHTGHGGQLPGWLEVCVPVGFCGCPLGCGCVPVGFCG